MLMGCGCRGLLLYCTYVRRWRVSSCPGRWCGRSVGRARRASDVGAAGINIEDFSLEHSAGQSAGIALICVLPAAAQGLEEALDAKGWRVVAG